MNKEIRFIDSRYNELFRIPDGGKIWIVRSNGEHHVRQCRYYDDYHFELLYENKDYGTVYHICQFAEQCEHNCIKYVPVVNRHYNIKRPLNNETEFAYVVRDAGCAARLGGEISSDGHESGTLRAYGLDCSGFVTWAFHNAGFDESAVGYGTSGQKANSTLVSSGSVQIGDLAFFSSYTHVGIVVGRDEGGNILVMHCSSGRNNVAITTAASAGFTVFRRPNCYR